MTNSRRILIPDEIQRSELSFKTARVQVWLFIIPCFLITGVFTFLAAACDSDLESAKAALFTTIACFMPAITAIVICLIKHIKISELALFPRLKGNVSVYAIVILIAVVMSLIDQPLTSAIFPDVVQFQNFDGFVFTMNALILFAVSLVGMISLLGEEIGWLGYLFPRLEQLYGTIPAVVLTGVFRGVWHLVMFLVIAPDTALIQFGMITVTNVLLNSLFIWAMKRTSSIIPAALVHSIANMLPSVYAAYTITNEELFIKNYWQMQMVSLIPTVMIAVACYMILFKWCKKL
ncbi:MAG: CPBP family intramembrane metalloprotease [Lachnospiraceae bacterium]|nr:CPBP family intramembrane metalloprotease [Lachnospiraceae bacterium]